MSRVCFSIIVVLAIASPALALPDFKKAFEQKYVKPAGNPAFEAAFKTASCNTCHVKGKKKNVRNAYGKVLADLIPGNAAMRIRAANNKAAEKTKINDKTIEAMKKAEAMEAPGGGTWGEMFKAHKLPPAPKE